MEICTIISPECAICANPASKKKALEMLSDTLAAQQLGVTSQEIFESLLLREKVGSTGIGNGIAIPHGKLAKIQQPVGALIKCEEPIAFDSLDNQPVDIIFSLLVPDDQSSQTHLETLAVIAEKLNDKQLVKRLRKATNKIELYRIITE